MNEIIILIVTFIILYFILKDNFVSTIKIISNMNILYFIISIFLYFLVCALEAYIMLLTIREYKRDYSFLESLKLSVITRFFNGITPFSTGGRPLQVIELKKSGVRVINGTNVIVQNFLIFQISLIIYSIFVIGLNLAFGIFPTDTFLYKMTILGFIVNIFILSLALVLSISETLNKKIVNFVISFLYKVKLIKDKEKYYSKCGKICDEYYSAFKDFKYKKGLIIKCILIELVSITISYLIVSTVFISLNVRPGNLLHIIVAANFVFLTGCYIPIPGGSGGTEYAFLGYFSSFATGSALSSILIIWRFVTYYFPTLFGGLLFNIRKNKN